uniref:Ribose-5-phosphate isomerase n=1 Tax=uncultured Bacillota bacterium TaxID=344338 RepID=A0A650ENV4_9FIRM|nr:ribose-5-phosphate isomerase [uncultured Firmicutes bacterium]
MIAIGCDHGGLNLKNYLMEQLKKEGYEFQDFGTHTTESCDYPDIAKEVCGAVKNGCDCGILICGTGIGMSIAANKVKGIRAAHVTDTFSARMAKEHNDAQIICLGERITGLDLGLEIVRAYLKAEHQGGRHANRVQKIMALED